MEVLRIVAIALAVGGGLVGAIGDGFFQQWAKKSGPEFIIGGYVMWMLMATIFVFMLRKNYMGVGGAAVMFLLVNIVAALLIGRYYFSEQLSSLQWIGVAVAIIAFLLMELGRSETA